MTDTPVTFTIIVFYFLMHKYNRCMDTRIKTLLSLLDGELLSGLCNAVSYLFYEFENINWLGLYFYHDEKLILGPFQGKVACSPLSLERGVCAKSFNERQIVNIDDVHKFIGHIACDSASNSELVIPLIYKNIIYGVLDIDSPIKNRFKKEDEIFFNKVANCISLCLYSRLKRR